MAEILLQQLSPDKAIISYLCFNQIIDPTCKKILPFIHHGNIPIPNTSLEISVPSLSDSAEKQ